MIEEYEGELSYPISAVREASERNVEKSKMLREAIHLLRVVLLKYPREIKDTSWEKDTKALIQRYRNVKDW